MKFILSNLLIISLIMSSAAPSWARGSVSAARAQNFMRAQAYRMHNFIRKPGPMAVTKTTVHGAKYGAEVAQTIFLIGIIMAIQMGNERAEKEKFAGRKVTMTDRIGFVGDAVVMLADHYPTYLSIFAGSALGAAAQQPIQTLLSLLTSPTAREAFRTLLRTGALSLISFIGWEFASQLWEEAVYMLDENEIGVAQRLHLHQFFSSSADRAIVSKIAVNIAQILTFQRPDVLRSLAYNLWRLHYGTGDFWTMVGVMTAAGFVTGSVVPLVGNVTGFFIGFGVGVGAGWASLYIPEEYKDRITQSWRNRRAGTNRALLSTNLADLKRVVFNLQNRNYVGDDIYNQEFVKLLKQRMSAREDLVTVYLEPYFHHLTHLQTVLQKIEHSKSLQMQLAQERAEGKPTSYVMTEQDHKDLHEVLKLPFPLKEKLDASANQMDDVFAKEVDTLTEFLNANAAQMTDVMKKALQNEISWITTVQGYVQVMTSLAVSQKALVGQAPGQEEVGLDQAAEREIFYFYTRGFHENEVRSLLTDLNQVDLALAARQAEGGK